MIESLIAVRAVHFAATVAASGAIFFRLWVAAPVVRRGADSRWSARLDARLVGIAWASLALVVVSAAAWLLLVAAEASGRPLAAALGGDVIAAVLTRTRFGHVWIARIAIAVALGLYLLRSRPDDRPLSLRGLAAALLAAALLGALALVGHGGATPGTAGVIHLASDLAHAIAAGTWVGGLVPLALLLAAARRAGDGSALAMAHAATRRFSTLGLVSFAVLLATGVVNAVFLVGSVPALLGTAYGRLLTVKIFLFAVMVAIAVVNRLRLTPRLAQAADAMRRLQRNSLFEAALGLAVLALVGALGAIPPALRVEP